MNVSRQNPQNNRQPSVSISRQKDSRQPSAVSHQQEGIGSPEASSLMVSDSRKWSEAKRADNQSPESGAQPNVLITILLYTLLVLSPCAWTEPEMCLIPAGLFTIGSDDDLPNEAPARKIYLDAYYIGKTEVTNAEYHQFWLENGGVGSEHTPISYKGEFGTWPRIAETKPNHPVIGVSWYSAVAYAAWRGMRLPTEAEWEKAARGTNARRWPWGNTFTQHINGTTVHANTWRQSMTHLRPVGAFPTGISPYGAHDMAGNVWEWVADWYSETYYRRSPDGNPQGPAVGSRRVVRGGSWLNREKLARCSTRIGHYPAIGTSFIGFRLAKDAELVHEK